MKTHTLKILPDFWCAVRCGDKTFEVRVNDRGFQKGDRLRLELYEPGTVQRNPPAIECDVSFVLSGWGLKNGYVALGLQNVVEA